ncbi:hypothetical protein GE061_008980 [Apolygus lucorum]|uniref:Uncharacterized protein n=1 Tax=Apolygus lucorum TaxID=248454 RepID=A0A6A4KH03_APOLU|nr:hypothetical protein GE061_008980 [Apolygus lucorum]
MSRSPGSRPEDDGDYYSDRNGVNQEEAGSQHHYAPAWGHRYPSDPPASQFSPFDMMSQMSNLQAVMANVANQMAGQNAVLLLNQGKHLRFTDFLPGKTDAKTWLSTASVVMSERRDETLSSLLSALIQAMKWPALSWLSEISHPGLTWEMFHQAFSNRFCYQDTPGAVLHKILTTPYRSDLAVQAQSQLTQLRGMASGKTVEELILLILASNIARTEPQIREWLYKKDLHRTNFD